MKNYSESLQLLKSLLHSDDSTEFRYSIRSNELENIVSKINDASSNIFIEDHDLNLINKKAIKRLKTIDFDADDKVPPGIIDKINV